MQWEGVEARLKGVELNVFPVCDYGMPYAYNPCLCAHPEWLETRPDVAKRFLAATANGYKAAAKDPEIAARILVESAAAHHGSVIDEALAKGSLEYLHDKFCDNKSGEWGYMEEDVGTLSPVALRRD